MFPAVLVLLVPPAFEVRERIALPGAGAWGRPAFDKPHRRLYVPREGRLQILDLKLGKVVADLPGLAGPRGVVLVPDRDLGFVSARDANEVVVFDRTNGAEIKRIPVPDGPDALAYDPRTRRVLVTTRQGLTPLDVDGLVATPRIALGGVATDVVVGDRGAVFVALGARGIARVDLARLRVASHLGQAAASLAYDARRGNLYALGGGTLSILAAKDGRARGSLPLVSSALLADFELGLAFALGADGTLSVVHAQTAAVAQTLPTAPGATAAAIDPDDHRLYLVAREGGQVEVLVVARVRGA